MISFLIYRQWRYLQANKTETRTEQQQDVALINEVTSAIDNVYVETTEEHSFLELRLLKGPQGESCAGNHYEELQGIVNSNRGLYIYLAKQIKGGAFPFRNPTPTSSPQTAITTSITF